MFSQLTRTPSASLTTLTLALASLTACAPSEPATTPNEPAVVPPAATSGAIAERVTGDDDAPPPSSAPASYRQVTPRVLSTRGSFLAPLTTAVTSFGAASDRDTLYVLGGYSGTPHAYSKEGQSADILAYRVGSETGWERIGSTSEALQGVPAVLFEGKLCHFGGSHASNAANTPAVMHSVTTARCLSVAEKTWSELPPLPEGRSSHAATLIGSTVYVVGGWTLSGKAESGIFLSDILTLDLKQPARGWKRIPAPFSRRALGVGTSGKNLVVVGGMTSEGQPSTDVDVLDTQTKKWTKGPAFPADAFGIAATSAGQRVYASGRDGVLRSLVPGEKAWKDERKLSYGRFFHQLLPVGNDLIVVGGIGGMHSRGRTRAIEKVSLNRSGLEYGEMVLEYPGLAKNRQGVLQNGEEVLLFGGNDSLEQHDFTREHFENESWIFDLATLEFRETTPYPFRRQSMQVLATKDGGIAVGGFGHEPSRDPKSEAVTQDQVIKFDWEKSEWTALANLPRGRTQFGIASTPNDAWIFGGLNYDPSRKGREAFDHDLSVWRAQLSSPEPSFELTDVKLPSPRRAFAGASFDGKYILVGGMRDNFELVEGCLSFDFATKSFSDFPCPASRLSGDLVPAGGKLFLIGGSVKGKDGIEESRRIDVYDPAKKKWADAGFEIPFSTRHLRALPYRDQILLLSTHTEKNEITIGIIRP